MSSLEDIFSDCFSAGHSLIELQNQGYWGKKELTLPGSSLLIYLCPQGVHSLYSV